MSNRPFLKPFPVVTNGNMSTDVIGQISLINQTSFISYTAVYTGSPVGSLQIEVCNDAQFNADGSYIAGTGTWVPLYFLVSGTNVTNSVAVSAAGNAFIDIDGCAAAFIRPHYIRTSGSGTLNITVAGKVS